MKERLIANIRPGASARRRALVVLALLICASAAPALAQSPEEDLPTPTQDQPTQGPRPAARTADLVRSLNLSQEQRAEIARVRRETEAQGRAIGQRLRRARRALEEALYATAADETLIEQRTSEVAAAEAERVRLRAQIELRIRRLLTPDQLNLFRELRVRALARQRRQRRLDRSPATLGRRLRRRQAGPAAAPAPGAAPAASNAAGSPPSAPPPAREQRRPALGPYRRPRLRPRP